MAYSTVINQSQKLLSLLHAYTPSASSEQINKKRMLELLASESACFERTCTPAHFTASSWLQNLAGDRFLLMHHAKLNIWLQPGGHCDGNGDVLAVAVREAQEETGIQAIAPVHADIFDLDIHAIPVHKDEAQHYHYDIRFLLQVRSEEQLLSNHESLALGWFGRDECELPPIDSSVQRMYSKWCSLS